MGGLYTYIQPKIKPRESTGKQQSKCINRKKKTKQSYAPDPIPTRRKCKKNKVGTYTTKTLQDRYEGFYTYKTNKTKMRAYPSRKHRKRKCMFLHVQNEALSQSLPLCFDH